MSEREKLIAQIDALQLVEPIVERNRAELDDCSANEVASGIIADINARISVLRCRVRRLDKSSQPTPANP